MGLQLEPGWQDQLGAEFDQDYMVRLRTFLQREKQQRKVIYPHSGDWFNAFSHTPLNKVKVVILGQDPYHGPGQAHGLCFSVRPGVVPPPSLVNMYKELNADLGIPMVRHGNLEKWAKEGVLLLNAVLTVERGQAGSHQGKGWEQFTDRVVQVLNEQHSGLVFLLWGSYAQKKGAMVDSDRHLVLRAPHPSPLSAHRGFFGCRHFSQANAYLESQGKTPINWQLPEVTDIE